MTKKKKKPAPPAALLGLGFDHDDGHKRITTGEQFAIVGGSEKTHERMTETVIKTFEEPADPPLTTRTGSRPSTPVEAQPTLARPFQVAVPLEDTD